MPIAIRCLLTALILLGTGGSAVVSATALDVGRPVAEGRAPRSTVSRAWEIGRTSDYHGGIVSPPLPKPKFTLADTSGAPFDFRSKTDGRVTLLFFGYTRCPDVCPMHMTFLAAALKKLPPDLATQFTVVFVTTDPDHDSPKVLRSWLDNFDKRFVGLTGRQSAIDAAQIAANIPPAKKSVRPNGSSQVSHAAFVLAYTKDNLAHVIYPSGISEEDWLHDLPELAASSWNSR